MVLPAPLATDHTDNAAGRQLEGEIINQFAVTKTFTQAFEIDHVLAETLRDGNSDLRSLGLLVAACLSRSS